MAAANAQPLRERVSFESNRPLTITLDGDGNATEQANRAGETEYRYFLQPHQIAWLPPHVHEAIQAADAGHGATFELTRRRAPRNWDVIHIEDEPQHGYGQASPTRPAPTPAPAKPEPCAKCGAAVFSGQPCAACATPFARGTDQAAAPARAPRPTPVSPAEAEPFSPGLYSALCAAIKCAQAAERYGQQIGRAISFDTSDIRAMAASLYIHANEGR